VSVSLRPATLFVTCVIGQLPVTSHDVIVVAHVVACASSNTFPATKNHPRLTHSVTHAWTSSNISTTLRLTEFIVFGNYTGDNIYESFLPEASI
jgi:hypothetical protein